MKSIIRETQYKNNHAYMIENDYVLAITVPSIGGKLVSIFDKSTGKEWLLNSGDRELQPIASGTKFVEADMSGWDECFPTVKPCTVSGTEFSDHGDIWDMSWNAESMAGGILSSVMNKYPTCRFSRLMTLQDNRLVLSYDVFNSSEQQIPFIWIPHPQFSLSEPTRILLPEPLNELLCVYNSDQQKINHIAAIPENWVIDPICNQTGEKYYTPKPVADAWSGLYGLESKSYIKLKTDANIARYLGIWIDRGLFNDRPVIALEPSIGYFDLLTRALENGTAAYIAPNESCKWYLEIELGQSN
ncbi:DUF5107 domain-containing protein [Paenibacillus nasutitermitis]|uniref:Uncharacterized protein n=1 Tax=Paenibacillus nasutitermitis TaxID=1652958 RepID=A0A916ZKC5_9BACL|nr:DUF5107 domain-containing protein [Paenibacillus nasutitermitis]GGE02118.1 hypothetical protein GCM10010911_71440 [Paenibacillus nasutitermitis]